MAGRMLGAGALADVVEAQGVTPGQVALAPREETGLVQAGAAGVELVATGEPAGTATAALVSTFHGHHSSG